MSRASLIKQLNAYRNRYPQEASIADRFVQFVDTYTDCFERSQLSGHVTGSAWLTNAAGTHVLLTHHRKLNRWLQLGGHADGDSDVLAVATREAVEESGITSIATVKTDLFDIDIHEIPARGSEPRHFHYDVRFASKVEGNEQFAVSGESHALEWVEIAKLGNRTTEQSMLRMAEKWLAADGGKLIPPE